MVTDEEFAELFRQNLNPYLEVLREDVVGRVIGYADTFAELPVEDVDHNPVELGNIGVLSRNDGTYLSGYYEYTTNGYIYKSPLVPYNSIVPHHFKVDTDGRTDFLAPNREVFMVHVGEWVHPDNYTRDQNGVYFNQGWTPPNPSIVSILVLI